MGGKRVCLGKTLAEVESKILFQSIIYQFGFEYSNPEHLVKKPRNTFFCLKEPEIKLKIKSLI